MTDTATGPGGRRARLVARLLIVALVVLAARYAAKGPPPPAPRSAPDTAFSAERAMDHVRVIAARPHPVGTAEHDRVRDYLMAQLTALGLAPELQRTTAVGTRFAVAGRVDNVVARLRGSEPGDRAVLVAAHYDGVGAAPAASDDASGTATVLEIVRALAAGPRPRHDVIALITDGEEVGLLGAAAFVREHPWAKDVEAIVNFEARGTGGRAVMFQTGRDNLDQIRILRRMPDVSATSLAVTVYRFLPNDTDLSEFFSLDKPGLNFAFADGVERYHTDEDDPDHLDPGAIQQEGAQALGVIRALAQGPLPRPASGDAIFFDLPALGLVYYPAGWARPIAALAAALLFAAGWAVARRERRWWLGLVLGLVAAAISMAAAGGLAYLAGRGAAPALGGPGPRGWFAWSLVAAALAMTTGTWAIVRRWSGPAALGLGPLIVWTGLAVAASWRLPGLSYAVVWPALAAGMALVFGKTDGSARALWIAAAAVTLAIVAPLLHGMGLVALGPIGPGGIAVGVLTPLAAWLLPGVLDLLVGRHRWRWAGAFLLAGAVGIWWSRRTAATSVDHPRRSLLAYAEPADSGGAWLATAAGYAEPGSWNLAALGTGAIRVAPDSTTPDGPPRWLTRIGGGRFPVMAAPVARQSIEGPSAAVIGDTTTGDGRRIELLVRPGASRFAVMIRPVGPEIVAALVDGRSVDRSRYRFRSEAWQLDYFAPPDSGFRLALTVPADSGLEVELVGQSLGLPPAVAAAIPPRPRPVVRSQNGDLSVGYRRVVVPQKGPPAPAAGSPGRR